MVSTSNSCRCFPSKGKVMTRTGLVNIRDVKPGDEVLAMDAQGQLTFSEVWAIAHDEPEAKMKVRVITTESGACLRLSPGHFLPTPGADGALTYSAASSIGPGMQVYTGSQAGQAARKERVVTVEEREDDGRHALLTLEGSQLVDGVVASNYEETAHPSVAHPALALFRQLYRWLPFSSAALNYKWKEGIPAWAQFARLYVAPFLPREL